MSNIKQDKKGEDLRVHLRNSIRRKLKPNMIS